MFRFNPHSELSVCCWFKDRPCTHTHKYSDVKCVRKVLLSETRILKNIRNINFVNSLYMRGRILTIVPLSVVVWICCIQRVFFL